MSDLDRLLELEHFINKSSMLKQEYQSLYEKLNVKINLFDELRQILTDVQQELTYLQELNNGLNYSCEQFSLENKKLKENPHKEIIPNDDGKSDIL